MSDHPAVGKPIDPDAATGQAAEETLTQHHHHIQAVLAAADTASPPAATPPASLGGYRIERILGAGGMGVVYLAHDERLDRAVALKTIKPEVAAHQEALSRFFREAKTAARIDHENVTPIWQVGEDQGIPFIAMPLLRGESLADRLDREPMPPLEVVLKIGRDVASGLAAAHALGLVHRDIKPANLWLEAGPSSGSANLGFARVKILDFGLARPVQDDSQLSTAGAILGTPAYMSPEQGKGASIDHRADLFSLGVLLYRMTTGSLPFPGSNTLAVLTALSTVTPPPVETINPAVPPELSSLIGRLLSKSAANRPASAQEVADVLATIPVPTPRTSSIILPSRVNRWKIAAGVAITVLAIIGVVLALSGSNSRTGQLADAGTTPKQRSENGGEPAHAKETPKGKTPVGSVPSTEPKKDGPDRIPGKPESDRDRRAAQWALSTGGIVTIKYPTGGGKVLQKMDKLPTTEFAVTAILFDINSVPVSDDDLQALRGLTELSSFDLSPVTSKITDEGMKHLAGLTSLTELTLAGGMTPKGLAEISGLPHLRRLSLYPKAATDEGLRQIKTHVGLRTLYLVCDSYVGITDEGLKHLAGMQDLEELSLRGARVKDLSTLGEHPGLKRLDLLDNPLSSEGLKALKQWPSLESLVLDGTAVTDDGLEQLTRLPRLNHLQLQRTHLTDAGLARLASMKGLKALFLRQTDVTDDGLRHLEGLTELKELDLTKTEVTPQGVDRLRKALPKCTITGPDA